MSTALAEADLDAIEKQFEIDLKRSRVHSIEENIFNQFDASVNARAGAMRDHYRLFYCLEVTIRELIVDTLTEEYAAAWWSKEHIPERIFTDINSRITKEIDAGVTPRSSDHIDFANFGELGEIIKLNWALFGQTFRSKLALQRLIAALNTLRGPIAHCSVLAEDEVARLHLAIRDWFRLTS